jgi:hypothetical protein
MKILKELSRKEYLFKFGSKDHCLVDTKWRVEYCCGKGKNSRFSAGKKEYNKCCSRCGYDESPSSHTLFHKIKFGIENGFEMADDIAQVRKAPAVFG